MSSFILLPRLIRHREAPRYLGMDKNRFNKEVRPHVTEIPIGDRGIAYDRFDLDKFADMIKERNGRPKSQFSGKGTDLWDEEEVWRGSESAAKSGILTSKCADMDDFSKALEAVTKRKQRGI